MAFSYGFFNAKNKDRVYTAEDFTEYLSSLICNGILDTYGQCFSVTAGNGLSVTIGTGKAWINGHYFTNNAPYALDLSQYANASQTQRVTIGICCDVNDDVRECSLVATAGAFYNTQTQTYLTLAVVNLIVGVHYITNTNITDCRADEKLCGYVKCILGKCGITELMARVAALEEKIEALGNLIGIAKGKHNIIMYGMAATGLVSPVSRAEPSISPLMGQVGLLEALKFKEEEESK